MTRKEAIAVLECLALEMNAILAGTPKSEATADQIKRCIDAYDMAISALRARQATTKLPEFSVIDTKTGAYPDVGSIALNEEWAKGLVYCDIDCFAINEDGNLILIDDCDNIAYPPAGRFQVVFADETQQHNAPLTLDELIKRNDPVFVSIKDFPNGGYWCLCKNGYIIPPSGHGFMAKERQNWVFYSQKPEEGTV